MVHIFLGDSADLVVQLDYGWCCLRRHRLGEMLCYACSSFVMALDIVLLMVQLTNRYFEHASFGLKDALNAKAHTQRR